MSSEAETQPPEPAVVDAESPSSPAAAAVSAGDKKVIGKQAGQVIRSMQMWVYWHGNVTHKTLTNLPTIGLAINYVR